MVTFVFYHNNGFSGAGEETNALKSTFIHKKKTNDILYVTCTQERCEGIVRKEYRNYKIIRDTDADVDAMLWYLLWLLKMN